MRFVHVKRKFWRNSGQNPGLSPQRLMPLCVCVGCGAENRKEVRHARPRWMSGRRGGVPTRHAMRRIAAAQMHTKAGKAARHRSAGRSQVLSVCFGRCEAIAVPTAEIITPAGGGGPAGVTKDDWQLGGGVLPIASEGRWEEECVAPNSCSISASGGSGLAASCRAFDRSASRSSVALHYAAPRFAGWINSDPMPEP